MSIEVTTNTLSQSKIDPVRAKAEIEASLKRWSLEFMTRMQDYPPALPWTSPPPKTGLRAGGRRTQTYGDGWGSKAQIVQEEFKITVRNLVEYAAWVGGYRDMYPGQAHFMEARGWPSVQDVSQKVLEDLRLSNQFRVFPAD